MEKGLFSRINPMYRGEVVLTPAEFALFFEGADLEKRFVESKSSRYPVGSGCFGGKSLNSLGV